MKMSLKSKIETKKNRLKRQSGRMFRESVKVFMVISIAAALAFCMVYAYNFAICDPYFQLSSTRVSGCKKVSEKEILELAGITPSMNILTMNLDKMKKKIRANPWVKEVAAGRELPNRLVIEIVERDAAAIIKMNEKLYLVDSDGNVFKEFKKDDNVDLPVLTGFYDGGMIKEELLEKGFKLLRYLSGSKIFPGIQNVSEILGDDIYGFTIVADERLLLELGFGYYNEKLRRLNKVVVELIKRGMGNVFLKIDLTDINRVVVRPVNILDTGNRAGGLGTDI